MVGLRHTLFVVLVVLLLPSALAAVDGTVTSPVSDAVLTTSPVTIVMSWNDLANVTIEQGQDGTGFSVINATNDTAQYNFSWTLPTDGLNYTLRVNITNSSDVTDFNTTIISNLTVDTTNPAVASQASNVTTVAPGTSIKLNVNVTDATLGVDTVLAKNTSSVALTLSGGSTYEVATTATALGCPASGACQVQFIANDTGGNQNATEVLTLTIDSTGPAVTGPSVNASYVKTGESIRIDVTASDTAVTVANVTVGNTSVVQMQSAGGNNYQLNTTLTALGCSEGVCQLRFNATDSLGNSNASVTISVTGDDTPPALTLNSPATGSTSNAVVLFNWTSTDALTSNINCTLQLDGVNNESIVGTGDFTTTKVLSEGVHSFNVTCVDNVSNSNLSETRTVTVDLTPPVVTAGQVNVSYVLGSDSIRINVNATDSGTTVGTVLVGNGSSVTMTSSGTSTYEVNTTATALGCAEGDCQLQFTVNDTVGNLNDSLTLTIRVDSTPPRVENLTINDTIVKSVTTIRIDVDVGDLNTTNVTVGNTSVVQMFSSGGNGYQVNTTSGTLGCSEGACLLVVTATDGLGLTNTTTTTFIVDDTPPALTLTAPVDGFNSSSAGVTFNWTATDTVSTALTCDVSFDGVVNQTFIGNSTFNTTQVFVDGGHNWSVSCADNATNTNTSATRSFTVDTTPPAVTGPSSNNSYVAPSTPIKVDVTVSDATLAVATVLVGNGSSVAMTSSGGNGYQVNTTASSLGCPSDGNCQLQFTANDTLGNTNDTVTLTIVIDSTPPRVENLTVNDTIAQSAASINIRVDVGDVNTTNVTVGNSSVVQLTSLGGNTYEVNTTYGTLGCSAEGSCVLIATAVDGAGNSNTTSATITVDNTPPSLTLNLPANNTFSSSASVTFNWTASDAIDTTASCGLYLNGTLNETIVGSGSVATTKVLSEGVHSWYVSCADNASNVNTSETRIVTVDTTNPAVSAQTSNDTYTKSNVTVNITVTVADGNINAVNVTNTTTASMTSLGGSLFSLITNFTSLGCTEGVCQLQFVAIDKAGNTNTTQTLSVTVDDTAPTIQQNSPGNNSFTNNGTVTLNWTVSDNLDTLNSCTVVIDNTNNGTVVGNGTLTLTQAYADGTYNWSVSCADNATNTVVSSTLNFTVDTRKPNVTASASSVGTATATISVTSNETVTFTVFYSTNSSNLSNNVSAGSGNTSSAGLTGLTASTQYFFLSQGCDQAGNCANSSLGNFTTAAVPAPASSGGGGGGGGGTRSVSQSAFGAELPPGGTRSTLSKFGTFRFEQSGEKHTVRIREIKEDRVVLVVESEPVLVEIGKGETKKVDVDQDGTVDIEITVEEIKLSSIIMTIRAIRGATRTEEGPEEKPGSPTKEETTGETPAGAPSPTPEETPEPASEETSSEPDSAAQEPARASWWVGVLVLLAVVGAGLMFYFRKR